MEKVGQPEDLDQAEMVSEGSQFGIQYYNEHVENRDASLKH